VANPAHTILPYAHGQPQLQGCLRTIADDFTVHEELDFALDGAGEHVWLWVRKRNANTDWVARRLAQQAKVSTAAVSYAGLKDRHAVTEQWFSVHLPGRMEPDWSADTEPDFTVLKATRHSRKLRRGALAGNRFCITVREMQGNMADFAERLRQITAIGVPNYFGEQRFGHAASNLERAEAMLRGTEKVRDRHLRGLYLSAARSDLFNAVLAQRVADRTWDQALPGDVLMLDGSHSIFAIAEPDETIQRRLAEFDLHPTGPLWGAGELRSSGCVQLLEESVAATRPIWRDGLAQAGLQHERRALRLPMRDAGLECLNDHTAVLQFRLPAGSYATTVLRELLQTSA
jgi:tRNA pseudouridine13 synthase